MPEITDFDIFSDTKNIDVLICNKLGIITGDTQNNFNPYSNLTREQAATILYRLCNVLKIDFENLKPTQRFNDYDKISEYARESVFKISNLNTPLDEFVMNGTLNNNFSPKDNLTLEQALVILVRLSTID